MSICNKSLDHEWHFSGLLVDWRTRAILVGRQCLAMLSTARRLRCGARLQHAAQTLECDAPTVSCELAQQ